MNPSKKELVARLLKIRTIALIPPLCRVAGQGLVVWGALLGRRAPLFFVHETQEDSTPAHVWQLHVRAGKVQDFQAILSSLIELAREQGGYRGVLALASGKSESPDVTLVALWDSLDAMRASENNLFLTEAISRYLVCCEGLPHIMEQELLACDFIATSARAKA